MQHGCEPVAELSAELRSALISAKMKRSKMIAQMGRSKQECLECMASALKVGFRV